MDIDRLKLACTEAEKVLTRAGFKEVRCEKVDFSWPDGTLVIFLRMEFPPPPPED
jgi:hypothetical protein